MHCHVLGLAHSPISTESVRDAFSLKVYNLCRMLRMKGHTVSLYGAAGSDASIADDFVECVSAESMERDYGASDRAQFLFDSGQGWTAQDEAWLEFRQKCGFELARRVGHKVNEPILLSLGWCHVAMLTGLRMLGACDKAAIIEAGIGYSPTVAAIRVFESYAWLHYQLGAEVAKKEANGANPSRTDVVIPNYYDLSHFEFKAQKKDYALFLGRIVDSKGWGAALEICKKGKMPLKVVGQLPKKDARDIIAAIEKTGAEYVPSVGLEDRKHLLADARCLICYTTYVGPFEGVAVEAQLSGTPVICSDLGAFAETVLHGITGWRIHTIGDGVRALGMLDEIRPEVCREWAESNYSLEAVAPMYDALLTQVVAGEPVDLRWIAKKYPVIPRTLGASLAEPTASGQK